MKKLIMTLGICSSLLGSIYAPNANAGIITVIASATHLGSNPGGATAGILVGGAITAGGFILKNNTVSTDWMRVGWALIVLDANQELRQDYFEQVFSQKYSFIDDHQVIADLAALAQHTVIASGALHQAMTVSLPSDEVTAILATTSLTAEQIAFVVKDLK